MAQPNDERRAAQRKPKSDGGGVANLHREPPHSIEAEEYVISCCFIDGPETVGKCVEKKLIPEAFYVSKNRTVYSKILEVYHRGAPIDIGVIAEELKQDKSFDEIGGYAYLLQVSGRLPTTAQADYFIEKVHELGLVRNLIRTLSGGVEQCFNYDGGLSPFCDLIESEVFRVTQGRVTTDVVGADKLAEMFAKQGAHLLENPGQLIGVPSGLRGLDKLTGGFQRSEMIILAARPSMGKTALALNVADHAAETGHNTMIFSLEMSAQQLAIRLGCSRARLNWDLVKAGLSPKIETAEKLRKAAESMAKLPLFIDDSSSITVNELRAKARRLHARRPLGLVVVDYLQLMNASDPRIPREQQVAEISRGLKGLAKELDAPVLVLSQLNRDTEREKRQPRLSDLRESGSIEQDADVVLLMARPSDADQNFQVAADQCELLVAKQRNGPVGSARLSFQSAITRFSDFVSPQPSTYSHGNDPE